MADGAMIEPGTPANTASEDEWVDWFNAHYAQVLTGGKLMILREIEREGRPEIEFLAKSAFRDWFIEHFVYRGEGENRKRYQWSDLWLRSPTRRRYDGLTFNPSPTGSETRYNLWREWPIECDPSTLCHLFTTHLAQVVCQGKQADYEWLMAFFASIIQDPKTKDGTAVLIRGRQGTGKTIVGQIMGKLFGPHYLAADDPRYLTGRFNSHLASCLLFQLEEAVWGGSHEAAGKLKGLITSPTLLVEFKGREPVDMPNYTRVLLTSNAGWSIPAALDDRRFAVFDTVETHRNDRPYFAAMLAQLEDGGYENLMNLLAYWPLDPLRTRTPPRTVGLYEQAVRSLPPEDQWYVDLLTAGELPGNRATEGVVAKPALYDHYIKAMQARNIPHRLSQDSFGHCLARLCPQILTSEREKNGAVRRWLYRFPHLEQCRDLIRTQWPDLLLWPKGPGEDATWQRSDSSDLEKQLGRGQPYAPQ